MGSSLTGPGSFAHELLSRLHEASLPASELLDVRVRGGTATFGFVEEGQWVALLRLSNGSGAFNVMDLSVRQKRGWASTGVRGVPNALAEALLGPLRFTWEVDVIEALSAKRTSDHEH